MFAAVSMLAFVTMAMNVRDSAHVRANAAALNKNG
jgi:hypothetical protein